jgi:hypothetical protein
MASSATIHGNDYGGSHTVQLSPASWWRARKPAEGRDQISDVHLRALINGQA